MYFTVLPRSAPPQAEAVPDASYTQKAVMWDSDSDTSDEDDLKVYGPVCTELDDSHARLGETDCNGVLTTNAST